MGYNSYGSERPALRFVGTALRPRPFGSKSGAEQGLDYHANAKAWMKMNLFFAWLARLNNYMKCALRRKVVLLIGNCSAYRTIENLPVLRSVESFFLRRNGAFKISPLDADVVASVKTGYRQRLYHSILDNIYAQAKNI